MRIRPLVPADAAAYHDLRLLALQESASAFGSSYEEERDRPLESIRQALGPESGRNVMGACVGSVIVGMVGLSREEGLKERHRATLRSMYVRPEYRRQGLGRHLVRAALDCADVMPGLRQITLAVTAGNDAAIALYASFGFTTYGVAPEALLVDGRYYDEVYMVRHRVARADRLRP
jgi:ribosomal protein S18 acetylase RimI-like enzyme